VVIDPMCFSGEDDQYYALKDLLGALVGPVARNKGRGRPRMDAERALCQHLAVAFNRDTGKVASDRSVKFMDVCAKIKEIYQLDDWRPESLLRSARQLRRSEE
jgi:hypothetical protein